MNSSRLLPSEKERIHFPQERTSGVDLESGLPKKHACIGNRMDSADCMHTLMCGDGEGVGVCVYGG